MGDEMVKKITLRCVAILGDTPANRMFVVRGDGSREAFKFITSQKLENFGRDGRGVRGSEQNAFIEKCVASGFEVAVDFGA